MVASGFPDHDPTCRKSRSRGSAWERELGYPVGARVTFVAGAPDPTHKLGSNSTLFAQGAYHPDQARMFVSQVGVVDSFR